MKNKINKNKQNNYKKKMQILMNQQLIYKINKNK